MRTLAVVAVLVLSALLVPTPAAQAASSYPLHFGAGNVPAGCDPEGGIDDDCYHIKHDINPLHSATIDVLIVPPASPMPERDVRIMRQAIEMWDAGLRFLALDMGLDWIAEGVAFNIFVDDGVITTDPAWDPEIVVIASNPVGGAGIGIMPVSFTGGCRGENPSAGLPWEQVPGFDNHHGRSGTYVDECNGDSVCFAINGAIDPDYSVVNVFNLFDLVAHEVGHCLTLGHVGNGFDGTANNVPCYDIMAYQSGCDWPEYPLRCVSTLDVESFAIGISPVLAAQGIGPGPLESNAGTWHAQDPDQHYYASPTGSPEDCIQPDVGPLPAAEPVDFYPGGLVHDVPVVQVLTPTSGSTIGGLLHVTGLVDPDGSPLLAELDAPTRGEKGRSLAVSGAGLGGTGSYTCSWSGTGTFASASACSTTVKFSSYALHQVVLTVSDGATTATASQSVAVKPAALPDTLATLTGQMIVYNVPGGIGLGNVVATATALNGDPHPAFLAGSRVTLASLNTAGTGASATSPCPAAKIHLFTSAGSRVGTWNAVGAPDGTADPFECRYDDTTDGGVVPVKGIPMPKKQGLYYFGLQMSVPGHADAFVTDTSVDHYTGLKPVRVLAAPHAPSSPGVPHLSVIAPQVPFVGPLAPASGLGALPALLDGLAPAPGRGVPATSPAAATTGARLPMAPLPVFGEPLPGTWSDARGASTVIDFQHEGGNVFYTEDSQGLLSDSSHRFELQVAEVSHVAFSLTFTDSVGLSDLDLLISGAATYASENGAGAAETFVLENVTGLLGIEVYPYLVTDVLAGTTYTLTATVTPTGEETPLDTDGDGVLDEDDDCPAVAGPASNGGCPVPDDSDVVVVTIGSLTATVPVDASAGSAEWAVDLDTSTLAAGTYDLVATWKDADGRTLASMTVEDLVVE